MHEMRPGHPQPDCARCKSWRARRARLAMVRLWVRKRRWAEALPSEATCMLCEPCIELIGSRAQVLYWLDEATVGDDREGNQA